MSWNQDWERIFIQTTQIPRNPHHMFSCRNVLYVSGYVTHNPGRTLPPPNSPEKHLTPSTIMYFVIITEKSIKSTKNANDFKPNRALFFPIMLFNYTHEFTSDAHWMFLQPHTLWGTSINLHTSEGLKTPTFQYFSQHVREAQLLMMLELTADSHHVTEGIMGDFLNPTQLGGKEWCQDVAPAETFMPFISFTNDPLIGKFNLMVLCLKIHLLTLVSLLRFHHLLVILE